MCRCHAIVYESISDDPVDQICGVTHVGSGVGASGSHVMLWNPIDFARIIKWGEVRIIQICLSIGIVFCLCLFVDKLCGYQSYVVFVASND